jgi:hypothetical protein
MTLISRETWNQRGYCNLIYLVLLATIYVGGIRNCTSQLYIFFWCPSSRRPGKPRLRVYIHTVIWTRGPVAASGGSAAVVATPSSDY